MRSNLGKRLGLIRARILGGDESRGDFLAFIDGHVRVAPDWLYEPYVLLSEHPHALVNYINFNLDAKTFTPLGVWKGLGRYPFELNLNTVLHRCMCHWSSFGVVDRIWICTHRLHMECLPRQKNGGCKVKWMLAWRSGEGRM